MLSATQAIILGLLQGATELFPVSSLGHMVIFPTLVGWNIDQSDPAFVVFIVVTHLATALVLLGYYARDWFQIIKGIFRSLRVREIRPEDIYAKLGWLIVASSIPVGVLGILFEKSFSALFAVPLYASLFLIGNGVLLYFTEKSIKRNTAFAFHDDKRIARLSWGKAMGIGFMQSLALFPGFSRTGTSMAGGLFAKLSHEDSARYAFLLATPLIFAAAVLKIPELALSGEAIPFVSFALGAFAAGIAAYLSVRFLTHYFQTKSLTPFAYYCVVIGVITLLMIPR